MKALAAIGLALLLGACSSAPERPLPADPRAEFLRHQSRLDQLRQWSLQGRAAVSQGEEGGTVNLEWEQGPQAYSLDLSGPFGSGHVRLSGDGTGARLVRGDEIIEAASAEILLDAALGWSVPVPDLRRWVLGQPGRSQQYEIDAHGRLARLRDGSWLVRYSRYEPVAGLDLPARLSLESGDLRIRLAISEWRTGTPSPVPAAGGGGPFSTGFDP